MLRSIRQMGASADCAWAEAQAEAGAQDITAGRQAWSRRADQPPLALIHHQGPRRLRQAGRRTAGGRRRAGCALAHHQSQAPDQGAVFWHHGPATAQWRARKEQPRPGCSGGRRLGHAWARSASTADQQAHLFASAAGLRPILRGDSHRAPRFSL